MTFFHALFLMIMHSRALFVMAMHGHISLLGSLLSRTTDKDCEIDVDMSHTQALNITSTYTQGVFVLQRNIQEIISQDNDLDSDVGMNLIQLLGGSNDFYGTKRRRSSCTSASSGDTVLSGRSADINPLFRTLHHPSIHTLNHPTIHSFVCSFTHSFIHSFIHPFSKWLPQGSAHSLQLVSRSRLLLDTTDRKQLSCGRC